MKNKLTVALMAILIASVTFGCKKKEDDGEVSPVIDSNTGLMKNGSYIRGSVLTTDEDGKPMEFSFDYEYQDEAIFFDGGTGGQTIGGNYFFKAFTDVNEDYPDRGYLSFNVDSIGDKTPSNAYLGIDATHGLDRNNVFYFATEDDAVVSNYKFDTINHVVSGNFAMSTDNTENGNEATISGSFLYNDVRRVVFRKAAK